jgi:hypothetical protein
MKKILLAALLSVSAAADADSCKVLFSATVGGQPALKPTTVEFRKAGKNEVFLKKEQHSFTTRELTCDEVFVVTAKIGDVKRSRSFYVAKIVNVIISMDYTSGK